MEIAGHAFDNHDRPEFHHESAAAAAWSKTAAFLTSHLPPPLTAWRRSGTDSRRAGTDLCHGVPAHGSRSSLAVSSFGATPVTIRPSSSTWSRPRPFGRLM